jgi:hypothetical protein
MELVKNAGHVALEMGNSAAIVMRHYFDIVEKTRRKRTSTSGLFRVATGKLSRWRSVEILFCVVLLDKSRTLLKVSGVA